MLAGFNSHPHHIDWQIGDIQKVLIPFNHICFAFEKIQFSV